MMTTLRKIVRAILSLFEKLPEEEVKVVEEFILGALDEKPSTAQKDRGC